jgi:hypothetical protein
MMKILKIATLVGALAAYAGTGVVRANEASLAGSGDPFEIWFDENGHAEASVNGGPLVPVVSGVEIEPTSGINALYYVLPLVVSPGDVRVWEDAGHTTLSDLLRFTTTKMYYFSDNSDGGTDLADTGFPAVIIPADNGGVEEVGPEGNNHFDFLPGGVLDNIYHGISDAPSNVPDAGPGVGLSPIAMLLPLFVRRFRR